MPGTGRFWRVQFLRYFRIRKCSALIRRWIPTPKIYRGGFVFNFSTQFSVGFQHQKYTAAVSCWNLSTQFSAGPQHQKGFRPSSKGCTRLVYNSPNLENHILGVIRIKPRFPEIASRLCGAVFSKGEKALPRRELTKKALSAKTATLKKGTYVPRKGPFSRGVVVVVTLGQIRPKSKNCV